MNTPWCDFWDFSWLNTEFARKAMINSNFSHFHNAVILKLAWYTAVEVGSLKFAGFESETYFSGKLSPFIRTLSDSRTMIACILCAVSCFNKFKNGATTALLFEREGTVKRLLFIARSWALFRSGPVLEYFSSAFSVLQHLIPVYFALRWCYMRRFATTILSATKLTTGMLHETTWVKFVFLRCKFLKLVVMADKHTDKHR